jgi:hypothetical protein
MTISYKINGWVWICFFSLLLSISLQWNTGIIPLDGPHDSLNYLNMAESILRDEWLGDYNQMALIRSPVYSMLLAFNGAMGWALQRMQAIAYLLSVGLLAVALKTIDMAGWRIAAVCILCSFHFVAWIPCRFVATEALYTPVITIALAGAIGVIGSVKRCGYPMGFWLMMLFISAAVAWRMRDESIWMIPAAVVFSVYLLWEMRSDKNRQKLDHERETGGFRNQISFFRGKRWKQWGLGMAGIGLPCLCVFALTVWIQQQNLRYYGIPVVTELAEPGFQSAFKWLTKLDSEIHHPYVPVTRKAISDACQVSPNFELLQPYLSRQFDGAGWSRFGCDYMGICNELAGGWTVWVIRDAAASIGMHDTADKAAGFYRDIARDIERGCSAGTVACTRNPTGNMLAPPMKWIDIFRVLKSGVKMIWMTIWLGDLPGTYHHMDAQKPSAELSTRYQFITGEPNNHERTFFIRYGGVLLWIFRMVQTIGGLWILASGLINGIRWIRGHSKISINSNGKRHWVIVLLIAVIISRLAIVSYIDAMSYWAQLRYMLVIYPALMTLICLLLPFPLVQRFHPLSFPR